MSVTVERGYTDKAFSVPRSREAPSRSLLKAITWRLTGTVDTFVIGFLVTGRVTIAGSHRCDGITDKIGADTTGTKSLVADTLGAAMSGTRPRT